MKAYGTHSWGGVEDYLQPSRGQHRKGNLASVVSPTAHEVTENGSLQQLFTTTHRWVVVKSCCHARQLVDQTFRKRMELNVTSGFAAFPIIYSFSSDIHSFIYPSIHHFSTFFIYHSHTPVCASQPWPQSVSRVSLGICLAAA